MDAVETSTPAVEQPISTPPAVNPETSLADHEAEFAPGAKRTPKPEPTATGDPSAATADATADTDRDAGGRFRQRAKSQQASPKDVDEIAELTKRLRQAEADAGITAPERRQGESDRAYSIRRQAEIAEALRDARRAPKPAPTPQPRHEPAPVATEQPALPAFSEKEPQPEDFADAANPLSAYTKALAGYEFRRQIHDAQQALITQRSAESQKAAIEAAHKHAATVQAKIDAFKVEHPDYDARIEAMEDLLLPDVLLETISTDDNPPKIAYALACNPDELVDLIGFAAALDYSPQSVALLRRRLKRHASATDVPVKATLASNPVQRQVEVAPRPPTRVPTGPLKTGDEPPGDDDMSLANHERYFGPKRR